MSKYKPSNKVVKLAEIAGGILLVGLFILPFLSMAGHKKIHVDDSASGTEDGTSSHPYKTITKALKHADSGDEIHVAKGEYKENIHLHDGIELYGASRDRVIIKADDDDYEVVDLDDDTKIDKVTIKGGRFGVRVGKDEKASITNCIIKDNKKDGFWLEESNTDDKYKVSISDSIIKDNGRAGIHSAKRRLILVDNEIIDNESDGADIEGGSRVWLENNKIKNNDGSGLKLTLDGSSIWTDDNSFSENKREGVEINSYGGAGRIDLHDSSIHGNDRWGIARVQRNHFNS
ncbi:MAG: right-handed parallel beta-helix repeat-containing protein, partial [Candidatus Moranbacteria bacterium]|nr:right-handed parallel beta-helix repeat-containing protein [Candidatus Moranbacteria bacterium]